VVEKKKNRGDRWSRPCGVAGPHGLRRKGRGEGREGWVFLNLFKFMFFQTFEL
jgi:hypothetical protein